MKTWFNKKITPLALIIVFILGWYSHKFYTFKNADSYVNLTHIIREKSVQYKFTNPLLYIDNTDLNFPALNPLKNIFQKNISRAVSSDKVLRASVYFRDLNTTRWTGLNEDDLYHPASMMKVLLFISYLKKAETNIGYLDKKLYYDGNSDKDSFYQFGHNIVKNNSYPIKDLLIDMIVKSGNDSTSVLFKNIDQVELAKIYNDLNFPSPKKDAEETISAKTYSRLFRVLYGSTYLQSDVSEQALYLLSQSEFNNGLKKYLPKDMIISHKFGERTSTNENGESIHQLHDCGIVYYPDKPYFLCIMTEGQNFADMEDLIGNISKDTYNFVGEKM